MEEVLTVHRDKWGEKHITVQILPLEELDVDALQSDDSVNLLVAQKISDPEMLWLMFGPLDPGEVIYICPPHLNWPRLLAHLKCFSSAGHAAKELKRQRRELEITRGFHDISLGDLKKLRVCLWRPLHGDWELQNSFPSGES